jgi:hypothetical protein
VIDLSLRKFGRRLDDHYDIVAAGTAVVGRVMLFTTTSTELPWVWTEAPGHEEGLPGHARVRRDP